MASITTGKQTSTDKLDIKENRLLALDSRILQELLKCHTRSTDKKPQNITWATTDYEELGKRVYGSSKQITVESVTGEFGEVIRPRTAKSKDEQRARTKGKAEVFTPSWIVKQQNELVIEAWEQNLKKNGQNNTQFWQENLDQFVKLNWLEITCGEAPYIVNRYDATSGVIIPITKRVGFLDKKLQAIREYGLKYLEFSESTEEKRKDYWIKHAKIAFQTSYGYEWQGDNLLIARENLLATFCDYYEFIFKEQPDIELQLEFAEIISWNIWQMDGLKFTLPDTEISAKIMDWENGKSMEYRELVESARFKSKLTSPERLESGETQPTLFEV